MSALRRFGGVLIVLGVTLMMVAAMIVMYNLDNDGDVAAATDEVVAALSKAIADRDGALPKSEAEAIAMREAGTDVVYVDGHAYIGYLTVPSQNLELPILSAWSYDNLKIAPCSYSGSIYSNDLVLCGHNYRSHFGRLNNLSIGDTIRFINVFGVVTDYRVAELQVLRPTAVDKMTKSRFDMTLFTCNMAGNARFTVRCMRAE